MLFKKLKKFTKKLLKKSVTLFEELKSINKVVIVKEIVKVNIVVAKKSTDNVHLFVGVFNVIIIKLV